MYKQNYKYVAFTATLLKAKTNNSVFKNVLFFVIFFKGSKSHIFQNFIIFKIIFRASVQHHYTNVRSFKIYEV